MTRNIRDRRDPNNRVVHVTNRVWEGLPFVPNRSMRRILKSVLAKAQNMYPVCICLYLFMGNHYHMIIAGDANRVSSFMGYIDAEIARRMKSFFPNRWGPRFWSDRFKEQLLCTPQDVINKISYICCNPMRARLVSNLSEYPGASSIGSLESIDNKTAELCSFTYPKHYKALGTNYLSKSADIKLAKKLQRKSAGYFPLKTNLFAWTKCFRSEIDKEEAIVNIKARIKEAEIWAESQGVIGAKRLQFQLFDKKYSPKKSNRTPFVECFDKLLRKIFIQDYQQFRAKCANAWQNVMLRIDSCWPRGAIVPSIFSNLINPMLVDSNSELKAIELVI